MISKSFGDLAASCSWSPESVVVLIASYLGMCGSKDDRGSRLGSCAQSEDERLAPQTFAQQSVHYALGFAFEPRLCRGLHRIKQELAVVLNVARESRFVQSRWLLAVMPTSLVIHVAPHSEVWRRNIGSHKAADPFPEGEPARTAATVSWIVFS